jgi:hypothetical protein
MRRGTPTSSGTPVSRRRAINGGEARGRAVRVPRDAVVTFRLQRALDMGVADRGSMRDGRHYHDYYDQQDRNH